MPYITVGVPYKQPQPRVNADSMQIEEGVECWSC